MRKISLITAFLISMTTLSFTHGWNNFTNPANADLNMSSNNITNVGEITVATLTVTSPDIVITATATYAKDADKLDDFHAAHFIDTTTAQSIDGSKTFKDQLNVEELDTKSYTLTVGTDSTTGDYDFAVATSGIFTTSYGFFHYRGDPATFDFAVGDFIRDGTYHDISISTIVPVGIKAIVLRVTASNTASGQLIQFKRGGQSNSFNLSLMRTQVANVFLDTCLVVPVDASRVIQYNISNTTWNTLVVSIIGWFF